MEQFMQRSLCDRTIREQKRVPVCVPFSVCAHALCEDCVCVNTEDPDGDIKHKQHKDQQKTNKTSFYWIKDFYI